MADYYKLVGHRNSTTNWTTEVVLAKNDEGEPSKVVRVGEPTNDLTNDDREKLESLGFVVEKSSASEAKQVEAETSSVGADVAGSAPVMSSAGEENVDQPPKGRNK